MHSISFSFFSMLFSNYILKCIKLYIKNIHIYIYFLKICIQNVCI